jgi:hypothetical protein
MVIFGTPLERRADLDIAIFKFVRKDLTAYYYENFKYELGETHYSTLGIPWPVIGLRGALSIDSGFHSFGINCIVQNNPETVTVYPPFHSRYTIGCFRKDDLCKVEGIIPKGSLYYKNSDEEYVSSHIIIRRITKVYEKARISNQR